MVMMRVRAVAEVVLLRLDVERLGPRLATFARAVSDQNAPLGVCWGFIDGTARPICRPTRNQRLYYSGHKRYHALKFQCVLTPDGMIAQLYGPVEGRRHDMFLVRDSGISAILAAPPFDQYVIYGDPGYVTEAGIVSPFKGADLTADQQAFNAAMSSERVPVEWAFGRIVALFGALDMVHNVLRVQSSPVAAYYLFAGIFSNFRTIMDRGNEISDKFRVQPPSLEEYLRCTYTP